MSYARFKAAMAMRRRRAFYRAYKRRYYKTPMRHAMGRAYGAYKKRKRYLRY